MKTAILLSGHMRTFDRCLPTLHWHVFRHFPNADFFVSTIADADAPKAELLRAKYPNSRVEIETVAEQPDCIAELRLRGCNLPAWWSKGTPYTHEPHAITVHPQSIARQLWQLEQVYIFHLAHLTETRGEMYDCVIRCRPDLWFHSFEYPATLRPIRKFHCHELGGYETVTGGMQPTTVLTPWWGGFGGVNDRFAILSRKAAQSYFTTYSKIPSLLEAGCPFHPESLIAASLQVSGFKSQVSALAAEFSTLRANGELRPPEISAEDIAHASLRAA
jgi:hypothetical protein